MPRQETDNSSKSFHFEHRFSDQASILNYEDQLNLSGSPPDSELSRAQHSWQFQGLLCPPPSMGKTSEATSLPTDKAPVPDTMALAVAGPLGLTAPRNMPTRTRPLTFASTLPIAEHQQHPWCSSCLPSMSAPQGSGTGPRNTAGDSLNRQAPTTDEYLNRQGPTADEGAKQPVPCRAGLTATGGGVSEDLTAALVAACNFVQQLRRQADLAVAPSAQRQQLHPHLQPLSPPSRKQALRSQPARDAAQTELQIEWLRRETAASVSCTERRRRAASESDGLAAPTVAPTAVQCDRPLSQHFSVPQACTAVEGIVSNGAVPNGAATVHGTWHRCPTKERLTTGSGRLMDAAAAAAKCGHVVGDGTAVIRTASFVVPKPTAACMDLSCGKATGPTSSVVSPAFDVDSCGGGRGQPELLEALARERARADALAAQVKDLQERLLRAANQPPHPQRTTSVHIRSASATSASLAAVMSPPQAHALLPPHPHHPRHLHPSHQHSAVTGAASTSSAAAVATATVFASPVTGGAAHTLHSPWAPPGSATATAVAAVLPYTTSPMRSWVPPLGSSPSFPPLLASSSLPGLLLHPSSQPPYHHSPTPPPPPPSHHQPQQSTQPPPQLQQPSCCVGGDLKLEAPIAAIALAPAMSAPAPSQSAAVCGLGCSSSGSWEAQWQQREAVRQRELERRWQVKLDAVIADHKVEMSMMESRHRKEVAALRSQAAAAQARASQLLATVAALQGDVRVCDQLINWLTPEPEGGGQRAVAVAVGMGVTSKREACAGATCV